MEQKAFCISAWIAGFQKILSKTEQKTEHLKGSLKVNTESEQKILLNPLRPRSFGSK